MAVVATSTVATALGAPNQSAAARFNLNGNEIVVFSDGTNLVCRYSTNGGTWQTPFAGGVIGAGLVQAHIYIDPYDTNDYIHVVARGNGGSSINGFTYLRGTPDTNRTSYTWAMFAVETAGVCTYPTVCAHAEGAEWRAHIAVTLESGGVSYSLYHYPMRITASGVISLLNARQTIASSSTVSTTTYPCISVDAAKTLRCSLKTNAPNFVLDVAPYSTGTWTWANGEIIIAGAYIGKHGVDSGGQVYAAGAVSGTLKVLRRAVAGGWTDISPSPAQAATAVTLAMDGDTPVIYFTNSGLFRRRYVSGKWDAAVTIDSNTNLQNPSARPTSAGGVLDVLAVTGAASPFTVNNYRSVVGSTSSSRRGYNAPIIGRGRRGAFSV